MSALPLNMFFSFFFCFKDEGFVFTIHAAFESYFSTKCHCHVVYMYVISVYVLSEFCAMCSQVVKVHQATVDLYLEDIILGTIEQTAEAQAREEIHRMAQELNDITYTLEETYVKLQSLSGYSESLALSEPVCGLSVFCVVLHAEYLYEPCTAVFF